MTWVGGGGLTSPEYRNTEEKAAVWDLEEQTLHKKGGH